ncbi:MAG: hypothetical protein K9L82_09940 [Chromatiaceae bacterium]|nr:hypothetical protein [Chromatiaceae bacterium]MCF7995968.1 hypothetical protein [Chromatiaceae bacterium]MCF8016500.1 hypothetical protein [Chromatiaceae bacterium]
MQPIRIIYEDTPDSIPIPEELRHRKTEIILWPLQDQAPSANSASGEELHQRRPGVWAHLALPDDDWDSPEVNREIAQALIGDDKFGDLLAEVKAVTGKSAD